MSTSLSLSFFDIQSLSVNQDLKDELTLAFLHGLDLSEYLSDKRVNFKVLRGIRLCLEHSVPKYIIDGNLDDKVLMSLFELYSHNQDLSVSKLDKYFNTGLLSIEADTFEVLVELVLRNVSIGSVDFHVVPRVSLELFASALEQGIDVSDLYDKRVARDKDKLEFLLSLRQSGVDITPFLNGEWSEEQITAIVQGASRISTVDLVKNYVNEHFTAGQILYCLKAVDYGCVDLVSSLDEDFYPLYNEYQMYQLVEGARFNLNIDLYSDPSLSDYEMMMKRTALFRQLDAKSSGALTSELSMKPVRRR